LTIHGSNPVNLYIFSKNKYTLDMSGEEGEVLLLNLWHKINIYNNERGSIEFLCLKTIRNYRCLDKFKVISSLQFFAHCITYVIQDIQGFVANLITKLSYEH
jgi:hypothetical protein